MCYGMYYDYKLVLLFQDTDPCHMRTLNASKSTRAQEDCRMTREIGLL